MWVSPAMAQNFFDLATLYLDNTDGGSQPYTTPFGVCGSRAVGSPVRNIAHRQILLGLLTAHFAALNAPLNGQPSPTTVGRIGSASEGSVSISMDYPQIAGAEFWGQSKYGMQFWQATARYRLGKYFPAPPRGRYLYGWSC